MLLFLSLGLLACNPSSSRNAPADKTAAGGDKPQAQGDVQDGAQDPRPGAEVPSGEPAKQPANEPANEPASEPTSEPTEGPPSHAGPLRITPRETDEGLLPHQPGSTAPEESMASYALAFGWDPSAERFVLCFSDGADLDTCRVYGVTEGSPTIDNKQVEDPRAWIDELGVTVGPTSWAYGADIELTWTKAGPQGLAFGVKLAEALGGDALPRQVVLDFSDSDAFEPEDRVLPEPEIVSLSADGRMLALVGRGSWGQETEYRVALMSTGEFAAEAYSGAGLRRLRADAPGLASDLFERAAKADPEQWKYPYNLACARARAGAPQVEEALARAIELGGARVVKKARGDSDFDSVRERPAFAELVAGQSSN